MRKEASVKVDDRPPVVSLMFKYAMPADNRARVESISG